MTSKMRAFFWLLFTSCVVISGTSTRLTRGAQMSTVINDFGIELYRKLPNKQNNLLCTTISVSTNLNGLLLGAGGSTAIQIRKVLGYDASAGLSQDQGIAFLQKFLSHLKANDAGYAFYNSISVPSTSVVSPKFQSAIENQLLIELASSTSNVQLQSSLQLPGVWKYQFDSTKTKMEPFYIDNGQHAVDVPVMYMKMYFKYAHIVDLNAELVEIPLAGDELTMVIILPREYDGIAAQNDNLDLQQLTQGVRELNTIGVHLRLPRFKFTSFFSLNEQLNRLGITNAFKPQEADFSVIDGGFDLSLSNVNHRASIEVTEKGSMPAPATNISDGIVPHGYDDPPMTYFTVDHPFTFLIRHKPTGIFLAIGQVTKL